ncbi:MAG: Creatinine amidohydrolase [Chloroflexi bacterium ADurb.Bin325]|nr:MAG: Creatinine amidohydrolase [Chloroflexi bacterium ADurb.Bin325]
MGVYSNRLTAEVRLERMTPEQIAAARARRPAIYVPCGSIEWHGYHNAVGLDALKAHEQLVGLAQQHGGVVYPPLYLGAGGGHTEWPSSFMVSRGPMVQLVSELLHGFERDGYRQAILLSGHYPNHPEYQQAAVDRYRATGGKMRVLSLIENQVPGVEGDHAAKQETSSMLYLHPNLVHIERLLDGPQDDIGGPNERINFMVDEYRGHPCYGLVGVDPRTHASAAEGRANTERLLDYLARWLDE